MPPRQRGYVVETWFNPVVITALSMPGWMEDHQRNMDRYAHMMSMGVLVGTDPRGSNRVKRFPLAGSQFAFAARQVVQRRRLLGMIELGVHVGQGAAPGGDVRSASRSCVRFRPDAA